MDTRDWASSNLACGVKNIKKTRLRVDDCSLLVSILDGGVVVVDEVVLNVLERES